MSATILRNVRPMGGPLADVLIRGGSFADGPAPPDATVIDGGGLLMLPGLVETHTHLDKNLFGMPWYRNEIGPRRIDRIVTDRREKKRLGIDPRRQSERQARATLAFGVTNIRTHVDVDTEIGVANVAGVLGTRAALAGLVDIQIVAFPQSGMLIRPGTLDLMDEALRMGADIVGGLDPGSIDRDPVAHLRVIFDLSQKHGKPIDIHLHEPGELGAFCLELIIEHTRALGLQGKVMVSHAYCLGMLEAGAHDALVAQIAEAGISIMTAGPPGRPAPAVKKLHQAGVVICGGCDAPRGTWEPYGNGDMLQRATMIGQRNGFSRDEDLELALHVCTAAGATAIGLQDYGLEPGKRADLVLVDVEAVAEAVASVPVRKLVMTHGRIVARDGALVPDIQGATALV